MIKTYVSLATLYGVLAGVLYAFGFWGTFRINILEFAGFSDIAKIAAYPVLTSWSGFLVGYGLSQIGPGGLLPPGGGADAPVGRWGLRHWRLLLSLYVLVLLAVVLLGPDPDKWVVFSVLAMVLSTPLSHVGFFITVFPNPAFRAAILSVMCLILPGALAYGKIHALSITQGRSAYVVDNSASQLSEGLDKYGALSYVGYIGGKFFLYSNTKRSIVIVDGSKAEPFVLMQRETVVSKGTR